MDDNKKIAVLIDADNAQASVIEGIFEEIAKYGEATVKRIYGDFTNNNSSSWKKILQVHAIKPVQQFSFTTGKNATDSMMIIDAMDLLYSRKFDGFVIVSSDSDFTGLAIRIREEGLSVLGFGEQKTPEPFRNACHKFIFTEVLRPGYKIEKHSTTSNDAIPFMLKALELSADENGWSLFSSFGGYLTKLKPDFDSRNYNFKKLSTMIESMPDVFELKREQVKTSQALYIRMKQNS